MDEQQNYVQDYDFQSCLCFINNKESLPNYVMDVFVRCCSKPIEQVLYNSVINKLPNDASYEDFVKAGAELYYLQSRLNKKIGRIYYNYEEEDRTLSVFIFDEIKSRRSDKFIGFERKTPQRAKFLDDIFECFLKSYLKFNNDYNVNLISMYEAIKQRYENKETIPTKELIEFLSSGIDAERYEEKDDGGDYLVYMEKCMKKYGLITSESNLLRVHLGITRKNSFKDRPPTKNELYYFSIACGLNLTEFNKLRGLVQLHKDVNPNDYLDIVATKRDGLIQAVIRDIERWIELTKVKVKDAWWPSKLVYDVNEMLRKNEFRDLFGKKDSMDD